jgi:DNA polymerase I-like protein with 3'-5' exonuclease and polymerase domains
VCDKFEKLILPTLDVSDLKGKDLVCFCKPKRCHCDAILLKANKEEKMKLRTALFDIEGDGLLKSKFIKYEDELVEIPPMTKIHCLCITEFETGRKFKFVGLKEIEKGVKLLEQAEMVVGHNILDFDLRAIAKVFPWFEFRGKVRDTLVMTRLMFSHQKELDFRLHERDRLPSKFIGRHSLDSWGYRIGKWKGDYSEQKEKEAKALGITNPLAIHMHVWGTYNEEMGEYCENDVDVTEELWKMLIELNYPEFPIIFEHEIADRLIQQEDNGFPFDTDAANKLRLELEKFREIISLECEEKFPGRMEPQKHVTYSQLREDFNGVNWDAVNNIELENSVYEMLANHPSDKKTPQIMIPKRSINYKDVTKGDRTAGAPYTPVYYKEFNPGSRQQVAERLIELGWKPEEFTEKGQPQVNEITLKHAADNIPIAGSLADYFGVQKTLGQLAEGENGWLRLVTAENKIHHHVNPCGAVTGRCTHANPNLGQVPSISKKEIEDEAGNKKKVIKMGREGGWGFECRSLFHTVSPFTMMGSDLSGIELRCLAHYMAEFDNGEYGKILLEGDIHSVNQQAAGLETREQAKTFIYATLYGAGPEKIGSIVLPFGTPDAQTRIGKELLDRFLRNMPALKKLMKKLKTEARRGWIEGIDGRRLYIRAQHAALNTLLQNAGAMLAKKWYLLFEEFMEDRGFVHSWEQDFAMMAFVHDEIQVAVREEIAQIAGETSVEAAAASGDFFKFKLPVEAQFKIGNNWALTH